LTSREEQVEASSAARLEQERRRNKDEQEEKRPKKSSRIESMMEKYLEMRTKQVEDERSQLSKEEAAQDDDFSIKRCVSVLNTMDVTKEEKVKAYGVFKRKNREIFLSAWSEDQEVSLMWLRSEGLFVLAFWELLGCRSQKLKQMASFQGEFVGCRKAIEAILE
jgi:hypothetical protein